MPRSTTTAPGRSSGVRPGATTTATSKGVPGLGRHARTPSPRGRPRHVTVWAAAALATALAAAVVTSAAALAPQAEPSASPAAFLSDTFDRTTGRGWGTATSGQAWSSSSPSRTSTSGGAGVVTLTSGSSATLTAAGVLSGDSRIAVSVTPAAIPAAGNGIFASVDLRSSRGHAYRATLRFGRAGQVSLNLGRLDGRSVRTLAADRLLPVVARAGQPFRLELETTGTARVTLRARAWRTGAQPPGWQLTATDSGKGRLAAVAAVAVRAYLSSASAATTVRFDDLFVQQVEGTTGTTAPARTSTPTGPTPTGTPLLPSASTRAAEGTPAAVVTAAAPSSPSASVSSSTAGSLPVGSTRYPVPAGAIFAAAGTPGVGDGTIGSPYGSAQAAIDAAPSGATIVLRGGTYHETVLVPPGKALTIQSYPGEAVWFDGSSAVTGWAASGGTWTVRWDHPFTHAVSYVSGQDESARFVDPAYPMAGYPDQVWVDGVALRQVGSASAVVPGTFYVDSLGKRMVLGSDPTGHRVDASTLVKGIQIQGAGSTVRGIGVRRYADHLAALGAISAEMPNITLQNVVVTQNATVGIFAWASGHTFDHVTATANGLLGLSANTADRLTLTSSRIIGNDTEHFRTEPASGGVKISRSIGVSVLDSVISSNATNGLWFDVYSSDITVARSTFADNGADGVLVELSERAVLASNHLVHNGRAGIGVVDSGDVAVWNDNISGNGEFAIRMMQDGRVSPDSTFPVTLRSIQIRNDLISVAPSSPCPVLVQDTTQTRYASDMALTFDENLYQRQSPTTPANLACLANGAAPFATYKTLATLRTTGNDGGSALLEGTAAVDPGDSLTMAARGMVRAAAVPAAVASALDVSTGWTGTIGALSPTLG